MPKTEQSLAEVFDGWGGFQASLIQAIGPLSADQLRWRPSANLHSVGELARHISMGRIEWFARMDAPGSADLIAQIEHWAQDSDGNRHIVESEIPIAEQAAELVHWLTLSGQMLERTLQQWTVDDLARTYRHTWNGDIYAISRQWTIWRILTHDVYHGGQISLLLGMQGIAHFELGDLFGHITLPPLADLG